MKVFLTGGTGVLGRSLVPKLLAAHHVVDATARREEAVHQLRDAGANPVDVDLFDADAVAKAVGENAPEAILHLATNVPPLRRASRRSAWATHNRLRTEATANLVAAGRSAGVRRFVKESITFTYPDCGEEWIDEDVPPSPDWPLLAPTLDGEKLALGFADGEERVAVVLRFGLFYGGPDNRNNDEMLRMARMGASTLAGKPNAYMSSIHVDDAARAVVAALRVAGGIYNVVDDEPLTRRAHLDAFSAAFDTRHLRTAPAAVMKIAGGRSAGALIASQRVSNRRFCDASGWSPQYPSAREGWTAEASKGGGDSHNAGAKRDA